MRKERDKLQEGVDQPQWGLVVWGWTVFLVLHVWYLLFRYRSKVPHTVDIPSNPKPGSLGKPIPKKSRMTGFCFLSIFAFWLDNLICSFGLQARQAQNGKSTVYLPSKINATPLLCHHRRIIQAAVARSSPRFLQARITRKRYSAIASATSRGLVL